MRVLIVEDAEDKRAELVTFLRTLAPPPEIREERSLQSGLRYLIKEGADLVVLDMSMPTYDISATESGGLHKHYAGRELLQQLERRGIRTPIIVVTQFDTFGNPPHERTLETLDHELREAHAAIYVGAVYYHATLDTWKPQLQSLIAAASSRARTSP